MPGAETVPPPELRERAWIGIEAAATYLGFSPSGIRSCIHRGELTPDGRGRHRKAMFFRETLDAFARRRRDRAPHRPQGAASDPSGPATEPARTALGDLLASYPTSEGER